MKTTKKEFLDAVQDVIDNKPKHVRNLQEKYLCSWDRRLLGHDPELDRLMYQYAESTHRAALAVVEYLEKKMASEPKP